MNSTVFREGEVVSSESPPYTLSETEDEYHLRLLSNAHYVLAGLCALGLSIPSTLIGIGLFSSFRSGISYTLLIVGSILLGLWVTYLILLILTARFLRGHRYRTFCLFVSGLNCLFLFGTPFPHMGGLGIFTLLVLFRDSVKALFRS